jgi:flagellar biogenesis protein FliO
MSNALQTTQGLLDIVPPATPAGTNLLMLITGMSLIILLMILAILAIRYFSSYRWQARRQLRQLQRSIKKLGSNDNYNLEKIDVRETAYQIARLFTVGVGINGINSLTTLPVGLSHHHERWQRFTWALSSARYGRQNSHPSSLDELFRETHFWLKNWP